MSADKPTRAANLFRSDATIWTGIGARVLLIDDGIEKTNHFGERLRSLEGWLNDDVEAAGPDAHAFRGASICAEGLEAGDCLDAPLGIAPSAEVLSTRYAPLLPDRYSSLFRELADSECCPHIVGHAYSAKQDNYLRLDGRADIAKATRIVPALHIAAAGHDGPGAVRFPGTSECVLTVGTHSVDGRIAPYIGSDFKLGKPELLVPDLRYSARLPDATLGSLSGSSAAVAIVAALAALWFERLTNDRVPHSALTLRAALLACSRRSVSGPCRIALGIDHVRSYSTTLCEAIGEDLEFDVEVLEENATVAICAGAMPSARLWHTSPPRLNSSIYDPDGTIAHQVGTSICLDLPLKPNLCLLVKADERTDGIAIFACGCKLEPKRRTRVSPRVRKEVIVGISASHNASACVLVGGELVASIQLERLSRVKNDGIPQLHSAEAIDYCLNAANIRHSDVDLFAFNIQSLTPSYVGLCQPVADQSFDAFDPFGSRAFYVSHHLSHAFASFFSSPFEEATVYVADGSGGTVVGGDDLLLTGEQLAAYIRKPLNGASGLHVASTYRFGQTGFELIERERALSFNVRSGSSSLGETYASVTQYVFGDWRDAGKLMGLAPYGKPGDVMDAFLQRDSDGKLQFGSSWKTAHNDGSVSKDPLQYRDLAANVQNAIELALIERMQRAVALVGISDVAYSGGLAMNSAANDRIMREAGISCMYIQPASNDAGIAIGAAAAARFYRTGRTRGEPPRSDFLGYSYKQEDCTSAVETCGTCIEQEPLDLEKVATRLSKGQVIGWFEGASEFGPRALGHRSILADPRRRSMWRHINRRIKFREEFRPFAPAVIEERASDFFELEQASPYMLRIVKTRELYRDLLAAVTHVDGTARVQTVNKQVLPRFHALLLAFERLVGLPILLNTSLNVRGQPIVETPRQAVDVLLSTHLDALVLQDTLISLKTFRIAIGLKSVISLAPDVSVEWRSANNVGKPVLLSHQRNVNIVITKELFRLLSETDGKQTIGAIVQAEGISGKNVPSMLESLDQFAVLRYVLRYDDDS